MPSGRRTAPPFRGNSRALSPAQAYPVTANKLAGASDEHATALDAHHHLGGALMATIDVFVVTSALTTIRLHLGASISELD